MPEELLGAMGYPAIKKLADFASVATKDLSKLSAHMKVGNAHVQISMFQCIFVNMINGQALMAGNGMDVPSVGFALFAVRFLMCFVCELHKINWLCLGNL